MLLRSLEITGKHPGPRLLVTGGVHGDEYEPMAAIRRLAAEIPVDRLRGTVTLVPVVNEPAFRRADRVGDDGLDLARTCPGRPDGSATEQIACELSALIRQSDFYIDLHTGGTRLRVLPLVGYMLHANPKVLDTQRRMARAFGLSIVWGTDPNLDGRSLSVARDAEVPAIYAEYLGGGGCEPAGVEAYVRGCLNVMTELGLLDQPAAAAASLPPELSPLIVEDDRPGAGHMQINHPSPLAGFFEPAAALGDRVAAGDLLGRVTDATGSERGPITARYAGLVIVLHTASHVEADTSVAVILELTGTTTTPAAVTSHSREPAARIRGPGDSQKQSDARVAFVTGAAGGIGRATAWELARRGYALALVDSNRAGLETLAGELRAAGSGVIAHAGDLADLTFAERALRETLANWQRLDLLVNNAAWRELLTMRRIGLESWDRTLRVCLTAPAFLARWAAESMEQRGGGVIINISSIRASQPDGIAAAYVAAKGGLDSLTCDLAALYGRAGIRVLSIQPGAIDTELSRDYTDGAGDSLTDDLRRSSEDMIPLGRWGRPEEIARTIAWLAGDDASYLTGTTITIDGGWTRNATPQSLKRRMRPDDFR